MFLDSIKSREDSFSFFFFFLRGYVLSCRASVSSLQSKITTSLVSLSLSFEGFFFFFLKKKRQVTTQIKTCPPSSLSPPFFLFFFFKKKDKKNGIDGQE